MSSTVDVGPVLTEYKISGVHTYLARWPALVVGALIGLLGLTLAVGGAYLAVLGGSWYYVIAGAAFLAAGYLMIRGKIEGFYTYLGAFVFTCLWTFWEVGLSGWQLIPRLVGPFVLLVLATLITPLLDQTIGRTARKWGLVGIGVFAVALGVLIPIFNQHPEALALPQARAEAF